jgi:ParB/RepB/Spo0J family partition protein
LLFLNRDAIQPDPTQPRRTFDQAALEQLAANIRAVGIIEPIVVRQTPKLQYVIVAGERRWRAAKLAGLEKIPAVLRTVDAGAAGVMQLTENNEREPLQPLETAAAYKRWLDETKRTQAELARALGKSDVHVSQVLGLLKLPKEVCKRVDAGEISFAHARELARVAHDPELLEQAVQALEDEQYRDGGWRKPTSKELEKEVTAILHEQAEAAAAADRAAKEKLAAEKKAAAEKERIRTDKKLQAQLAKERAAAARAAQRKRDAAAKEVAERDRETAIEKFVPIVAAELAPRWAKEIAALAAQVKLPAKVQAFLHRQHAGEHTLDDILWEAERGDRLFDLLRKRLGGKWAPGLGRPANPQAEGVAIALAYWLSVNGEFVNAELGRLAAQRYAAAQKAPAKVPARKGRGK